MFSWELISSPQTPSTNRVHSWQQALRNTGQNHHKRINILHHLFLNLLLKSYCLALPTSEFFGASKPPQWWCYAYVQDGSWWTYFHKWLWNFPQGNFICLVKIIVSGEFIFTLIIILVDLLCVHVFALVCMSVCTYGNQRKIPTNTFSSPRLGPEEWTWVFRLDIKHLYLLTHLASLTFESFKQLEQGSPAKTIHQFNVRGTQHCSN